MNIKKSKAECVSEQHRDRWVNEMLDGARYMEPGQTNWTLCGGSMVVLHKDEDGDLSVYDCKVLRTGFSWDQPSAPEPEYTEQPDPALFVDDTLYDE